MQVRMDRSGRYIVIVNTDRKNLCGYLEMQPKGVALVTQSTVLTEKAFPILMQADARKAMKAMRAHAEMTTVTPEAAKYLDAKR